MTELGGFMVPLEMEGDQLRSSCWSPSGPMRSPTRTESIKRYWLMPASPVEFRSLYDPIWVQGPVEVFQEDGEIAQTGYRIMALRISNLLMRAQSVGRTPP